jgi:hypothetical protein
MGAKLIAFECAASAWAFCPFDARAQGHLWRSTGGADLETLLRHVGLSVSGEGLVTAGR